MGTAIYKLSGKISFQVKKTHIPEGKYICHSYCRDLVHLDYPQNGKLASRTNAREVRRLGKKNAQVGTEGKEQLFPVIRSRLSTAVWARADILNPILRQINRRCNSLRAGIIDSLLLAKERRSSWGLQLLRQIDFKGGLARRSRLWELGQETEVWVTPVIPTGGTWVTLYLNPRSDSHTLVLDPAFISPGYSSNSLA